MRDTINSAVTGTIKDTIKFTAKELLGDSSFAIMRHRDLAAEGMAAYGDAFRATLGEARNLLMCLPDHANLGDQAIAVAERRMLAAASNKPVIACEGDAAKALTCLRELTNERDTVFLQGGGNMGELYPYEEEYRCAIIDAMPCNRIVLFPQTISYGDSPAARTLLRHTQRVYSKHPDLHLFARERRSYEAMRRLYPKNHVYLTPDVVLSLAGFDQEPFAERAGVLLCMRDDAEKRADNAAMAAIAHFVKTADEPLLTTDTVLTDVELPVRPEDAEPLVRAKLAEFQRARVVITDRLHGMIFSAITGTPCLALNNSNGKVGLVHEWIRELPYVRFVDAAERIEEELDALMRLEGTAYPHEAISEGFAPLRALIAG